MANPWNTLDPASRARQEKRLTGLFPDPVRLDRAARAAMNGLVLSFPHSGREYPAIMVRNSRLSARDLRRSEDAFVDELVTLGPDQGFSRLVAQFPRAWVDVNRHMDMVDPKLFAGLEDENLPLTPQVMAGLGVVPRVVAEGMPIYRHKLPLWELDVRLNTTWHPYHQAVFGVLADTRAAKGRAVLVDCHSMPGPCRGKGKQDLAEIVLGDGHGSTCDAAISDALQAAFANQGFRTARNQPYAGGYSVRAHGKAGTNQQAIQVELCRSLYMDEDRIEKSTCFADISRRFSNAVAEFAANLPKPVPD